MTALIVASSTESLNEVCDPDFAGPFTGPPVRKINRLSLEDIQAAFAGRVLGTVQHGYVPPEICQHAAPRAVSNRHMRDYEVEKVKTYGTSFMDVGINPALAQSYFDEAPDAMNDLRSVFAPFGSVIDRLQAQLDEIWPAGARIMTLPFGGKDRKVKRGTCREFPEGQKIDCHHDNFWFDARHSFPMAPRIRRQLSFNVYLRCAPSGGQLVLYPRRIRSLAEESALRDPMSRYGLRAELLGTPHEIRPQAGDCIMFCANRGHNVQPSFGGSRVTASVFAGMIDEDQPLMLFN